MARRNPNNAQLAVNNEINAEVMSSRITAKLQSIQNVNPGDTAVLRINPGLTYDKVILVMENNVVATDLTNIKLKVGTKVISAWKDGSEVANINSYYGRHEADNHLTFHFSRTEFNTLAQRDRFSIATMNDDLGNVIRQFTLEFDIKGTAPADLSIVAWAVQTPARRGIGRDITKVRRMSSMDLVVGENEKTDIPALGSIMAIHFMTENITNIELSIETRKVFEAPRDIMLLNAEQAKFKRSPVAGWTTMDWCLTGTPSSAIRVDGAIDLRFKITTTQAENVDVLIEYIDRIHGPV